MTKKIGLFGGTFDPVHYGHLNLAFELQEKANLDEVWFIPASISPLRGDDPPIDMRHRLKMLHLGVVDIPSFKICEYELSRPPPSYTIDTVKQILQEYPRETFYLLLGEDCLENFSKWKNNLEITHLLTLLIGSRPQLGVKKKIASLNLDQEIVQAIQSGLVVTKQMDISSTELRNRLKKRLYCRHLIPVKSLDYIYENQLYFNEK